MFIKLLVNLIPVLVLLLLLVFLDSFKLVRKDLLSACLAWGVFSAGLSYMANIFCMNAFSIPFHTYSAFIAPVVEESLKFTLVLFLIKRNKIGFMIDGAIYGFATGAAFALAENLFYLINGSSGMDNPMLWITRGFGTSVMHGGATALFAIVCMGALNRQASLLMGIISGAPGAFFIHGLFNQFLVSPLLSTILIIFIVPLTILLVFGYNEKTIRQWLVLEFDSEVKIINMIRQGQFSKVRSGSYLLSVRSHFPPEVVVDMYCYIVLHIELSVRAKSIMLLKELDLPVPADDSIEARLAELKALRRSIGRGGLLAIAPVLRMSHKDLWKLSLL
jgi:protease PrsW